jgi:hypothetical protein
MDQLIGGEGARLNPAAITPPDARQVEMLRKYGVEYAMNAGQVQSIE